MAVVDLGPGPSLYVGGRIHTVYDPRGLLSYDGTYWREVTSPPAATRITALTGFDDGGGTRLIAGGTFELIFLVQSHGVSAWDGTTWTPLGDAFDDTVLCLEVFDDGQGPALYAGGPFTTVGGQAAEHLARWDGSSWSSVGGLDGPVHALEVHDDGSGQALYVGGEFTQAGDTPARGIARWDGLSWSRLDHGVGGAVNALESYMPEEGPARLYVGGEFTTPTLNVAAWGCQERPDPNAHWADLGGGTSGVTGVPALELSGQLTPFSAVQLKLGRAAPSSVAVVFYALGSAPTPFLGGTLHAYPVDTGLVMGTDAFGRIELSTVFPGFFINSQIYFQVAVQDASVPVFGASLSHAQRGTIP